ncbi:hypothetical protein BACERE00175_05080 [Bacillus cereus]|uniref:hypothetical protein n=1 Tax=Bacillus cereus TaxID=1396 RepID=UPI000A301111|nr:hypothetical protein [Bacillus cereus]SME42420.1 hypothetical protein BACERE00175_05080 [Bacillus cereus]
MKNNTNKKIFNLIGAIKYLFDTKQCTLSWAFSTSENSNRAEYQLFNSLFGLVEKTFSKEKIDHFKHTHTRFDELIKMIKSFITINENSRNDVILNRCTLIGIDILSFGRTLNRKFIKNQDIEKLIEYNKFIHSDPTCKLYAKLDFGKKLGVGKRKLQVILDEYNIHPFVTTKKDSLFHQRDLVFLKNKQKDLLYNIRNNFYTEEQLLNLEGISFHEANPFFQKYKIDTPYLGKIKSDGFDYSFAKKIISKSDVTKALEELRLQKDEKMKSQGKRVTSYTSKNDKQAKQIFHEHLNNPYHAFSLLSNHFNIAFHENLSFTQYHWNNFVRQKLNATTKQNKGLKSFIMLMINITNLLTEVIQHKEILSLSTKQIKSFLFSKHIPIAWRLQIYSFLYQLTEMCNREGIKGLNFDISLIENPKHSIGVKDKTIYSIEEFTSLLDYCKEIEQHKTKAILEAKRQINNSSAVKNYANMWLLVIIHLNNAWRIEDALDFPGLPDTMFQHIDLNWLQENKLTDNEATLIADYYRGKTYIHSKTNQNRYFTLSKELELPFAYSVLISTIIQRNLYPLSNNAFSFPNTNSVYGINHAFFFDSFLNRYANFEFRSMKMNRTLLSCMVSVVKDMTKRNPVELIKLMRNHSDIEVTNIYIDIPQDKVDTIATQLFNLGNFGFVYDTMSTIINEKQESNRIKRTKNALMVKDFFSSINHIEGIAAFINTISDERNVVKDIMYEIPTQELREKYTLLNLGLLPSKSHHLQCLVGELNCPFPSADCQNCTLSVPNIYTLSTINDRIQSKLTEFASNFNKTQLPAEKTKLANQLFIEREILMQAIETFGRERVEPFLEGGFEQLNTLWKTLPSFKEHITISGERS